MGVKLKEILNPTQITFKELKGKKIAIDVSNMVYQFLSSIRQPDGTPLQDAQGKITSHLMGLSTRIPNLMEQGIKLVFVFDGRPPELKSQEIGMRSERKEIAKKKLSKAKTDFEKLKLQKQSITVTSEILTETKEFLKALGLPVIQAPSEAGIRLVQYAQFFLRLVGVFFVVEFDGYLVYAVRTLNHVGDVLAECRVAVCEAHVVDAVASEIAVQ